MAALGLKGMESNGSTKPVAGEPKALRGFGTLTVPFTPDMPHRGRGAQQGSWAPFPGTQAAAGVQADLKVRQAQKGPPGRPVQSVEGSAGRKGQQVPSA